MSRIGKKPIPIPSGATVAVSGQRVDVTGPLGKLDWAFPGEIAVTACRRAGRVLTSDGYEPKIFFVRQTDGACALRVAFWIDDPDKGISNVKSEVFREIIRAFNENNITLPLPQQAVHVLYAGPSDSESRTAALRSTTAKP